MKITASTLSAILALASSALSAPLETREELIYPTTTSQYNVWTGAVTYNTQQGLIHKSNGQSADITTLVTFDFPSTLAGRTCAFIFELDDTATLSGSKRAQVFTSLAPAYATTTTWPHGNLRDQHLGDLLFNKPGRATVEATYGDANLNGFPCPAGQTIGGELVGRWDEVKVRWDVNLAGPRIKVL